MSVTVKVNVSKALNVPADMRGAIQSQFEGDNSGPFNDMRTQWVSRYQAHARRHFDIASRGGADWPPLSVNTILGRKAGDGKGTRRNQRSILRGQLRGIKDVKAARAIGRTRSEQVNKQVKLNLKAALHNERSAVKRDKIKAKIAALTSMAGVAILKDTGALYNALAIGGSGSFVRRGRNSITFGFASVRHNRGGPTFAQLASWHDAGEGNLPARRILIDPDDALLRSMANDFRAAADKVIAETRRKNGGG